ncbi:MAG: hypothetical protein AAFN41_05035, partial [Planctomycetota bacterium]
DDFKVNWAQEHSRLRVGVDGTDVQAFILAYVCQELIDNPLHSDSSDFPEVVVFELRIPVDQMLNPVEIIKQSQALSE